MSVRRRRPMNDDPSRATYRRPVSDRRVRDRRGRGMHAGPLVVIVLLVLAVLAAAAFALARPFGGAQRAAATTRGTTRATALEAAPSGPTGVFAHMRRYGVALHFPAVAADMIAVGYHQAWNTKATEMVPALKTHPKDKYAATSQALLEDPALKLFLMMSRGRGSSEYSAVDCAMKRGSLVLAPVTGVVTLVKTYKLRGYGTDYRVEIEADGASAVRVVLIHLTDVSVKPGDRVEGGVTPIATVRHLTGIDNQVNKYLPVDADHTHIQINDVGYVLNESS